MKIALPFLAVLLFSCDKHVMLTFHKFDENRTGQTLAVKEINSSYNYILFIGTGTTVYEINNKDNKVPYDYFYAPFTGVDSIDALADKIKNVPLNILVDTSNIVQLPFYPDIPDSLPGQQIEDWIIKNRKMMDAYPVYIWNRSDAITSIPVQGVTTDLIQEARDENGNWRPIEYYINGFCGNGMWDYILEPDYYIITSVYKYSGDFETDMRIKFSRGDKIYYSNTFRGHINKGQFELNEKFKSYETFLDWQKK